MTWLRAAFLLLLSLLSFWTHAGDYPFEVRGLRNGVQTILMASNRGPGSVAVHIEVTGVNVGSNRQLPVLAVVPPHTEQEVLRLFPARPGSSQYQWNTSFMLGDINARADPLARYRLPYLDGYTFNIGQAPGGRVTTHLTSDSRDAVDFTMPEGTPIVAAREGVVIRTEAGFANQGGLDPALLGKANSVEIEHRDGTIALYAHLRHAGVIVSPGQRVKAGDIIGYSGSTGYSGGPHLHFAVQVTREDAAGKFARVSMPFMFFVGTPAIAFRPVEGLVATADYSSRAAVPTMSAPIMRPQPESAARIDEAKARSLGQQGRRDPFTDQLAAEAAKNGQAAVQEQGGKILIEISGPYVDFIRSLPGWVLYAGAVLIVLLFLVANRPARTHQSRSEPRL